MTHRIIFHRQLSAISPINSESDGIGLNQGAGGGRVKNSQELYYIVHSFYLQEPQYLAISEKK